MENNIKERTLEFIKYKGIKMKVFEQACGLSSGYVTSMRKGFGSDKLNNVLNAYPELNRNWLLYGEGSMLNDNKTINTIEKQSETTEEIVAKFISLLEKKDEQMDRLIGIIEKSTNK